MKDKNSYAILGVVFIVIAGVLGLSGSSTASFICLIFAGIFFFMGN